MPLPGKDLTPSTLPEWQSSRSDAGWTGEAPARFHTPFDPGSNPGPAPNPIDASYSYAPDPEGEMRQWVGQSAFVRVGRSSLEVNEGQLLWFGPSGVWIDTVCTVLIDPLLRSRSISRGRLSKSAYHQAVRSQVQRLQVAPASNPISDEPLFRIYRPG